MNYVHLTNDRLLGSYEWEGKMDLLGIVLIGLSKELPEYDEKYELHRLLGALLSKSLSSDEKLRIIETEYDIPIEESIRKENRYGRYKNRKRESKRDYGQAGGKHWRLSKEPDIFSKQYKVLFLV
jgi:hypothetical protein